MDSVYDAFAWFYDRYWATPYQEWLYPALASLLLSHVAPPKHLLDLCCGTGSLAAYLVACNYTVTGVDSSRQMLEIARARLPDQVFLHRDASDFELEKPADAAVCVFDSLNHLLEPDGVRRAFCCVGSTLNPGGIFVIDFNTRAAYGSDWDRSACHVEPDHAFFLRGQFDPYEIIGKTDVTMFRLIDGWQRWDSEIRQRPWEREELEPMLSAAGFSRIKSYRPLEDLGLQGHFGAGRLFMRAHRD